MTDTARESVSAAGARAPMPSEFPVFPPGWFLFCHERDLRRGPYARDFLGRRLVAFRPRAGEAVAVLDARCSHMGADLAGGDVHEGCLRCPFHHWQYGADGRCTRIAAQEEIPRFARQRAYPTAEVGGHVFVYNGRDETVRLPFFTGKSPADFVAAKPFSFLVHCPWYLISSNGFDAQHFAAAHDRELLGPVEVESHDEWCRAAAEFRIVGNSWQDAATRIFSGRTLTMTVTSHGGTLVLVTARFRRTTSYGLVSILPLEAEKTLVSVIAWVPQSGHAVLRGVFDGLHARVRAYFIRKFVEPDARVSQGCTYHPRRLIAADSIMAGYLTWLAAAMARHESSPSSTRDP